MANTKCASSIVAAGSLYGLVMSYACRPGGRRTVHTVKEASRPLGVLHVPVLSRVPCQDILRGQLPSARELTPLPSAARPGLSLPCNALRPRTHLPAAAFARRVRRQRRLQRRRSVIGDARRGGARHDGRGPGLDLPARRRRRCIASSTLRPVPSRSRCSCPAHGCILGAACHCVTLLGIGGAVGHGNAARGEGDWLRGPYGRDPAACRCVRHPVASCCCLGLRAGGRELGGEADGAGRTGRGGAGSLLVRWVGGGRGGCCGHAGPC